MAHAAKYAQVMSAIERRIAQGDYQFRRIPGERRIAEETGVSYMTARRAVTELVRRNVLIRRPNGTLDPHPDYLKQASPSRTVLLYPSFPSPHLSQLRWTVAAALEQRGQGVRPVQYVHWDDPVVMESLTQSAGAFVVPSTEPVPERILAVMKDHKVAVLDGDFSQSGIPSIQPFPDRHIAMVLNYVARLGHRRIDCLNTQPSNPEIDRRISLWKHWLTDIGESGKLWDYPADSYTDPVPNAYEAVGRLVDRRQFRATALVCTTFPAAIGAIRAFWERGWKIGEDVAVCAINLEHFARYFCPSITGLDMPDLAPQILQCADWFAAQSDWRGSFRLEPQAVRFFLGESCGASEVAPQRSRAAGRS